MKIHRFHVSEPLPTPSGSTTSPFFLLSPELYTQMYRVLRLKLGETVILFNGDGLEYVSNIVSYPKKNTVEFSVSEIKPSLIGLKKDLTVFFSLIKKDNIELILQKGTELGVTHFIPVLSARSEKKGINLTRAEKIIIEATEQCGRNTPPTIQDVVNLENIFTDLHDTVKYPPPNIIVLEKGHEPLNQGIFNKTDVIGILIGPEGGWAPKEIAFFETKKATFRSLGQTTLRAETAAIVASAFLLS